MPTYACSVSAGSLTPQQKSQIAAGITRIHTEATGAPAYFVQVVIEERTTSELFLGGVPAVQHIWIRGDIRAGRTKAQREQLMLAIMKAVSTIAAIDPNSVWINLCNLEPTDMVEYGHVLPEPGQEQEWFDRLPQLLQTYLIGLGTEGKEFTL